MVLSLAWRALLAAEGAQGVFTVGPVTAAAGQMASGSIPVPAGADAETFIPVTVLHGVRPGPVLALIAGNHGYEYAPILALQRLRAELDPARMAGTVILVHVATCRLFCGARSTTDRWTART